MPAELARGAAVPAPRARQRVPWQAAGAAVGGAGLIGVGIALGSDYALLIVLALLGITALVVLLAWPELALPVAVFLIWSNIPAVAVDAGAPSLVSVAVPLILVAPLATTFLRGGMLTIDRTFILLLALLGVYVACTTFSAKPEIGVHRTVTFLTEGIVLYFLVFNAVRTPRTLQWAVWAMLAAGSFLAAITVFQNLTHTFDRPYFGFSPLDIQYFLGKEPTPRAFGPVGDPNYYGQILVATIALGVPALCGLRRGLIRLFVGGAVVLMLLALAFTYSRGGMLALLIVIGVMVGMGYLKIRHLASMVLMLAVVVLAVPGYRDRIESLTKVSGLTAQNGASNEADIAARGRFTENSTAILVFFDYPLIGVGPGAFGDYYQEYAVRTGGPVHRATRRGASGAAAGEAPKREAHNLFLSAAAETGVVGLFALCAVLLTAFRQLLQARRRWLRPDDDSKHIMAGLLLALTGYLAAGVFLSLAFERYLWLLLALVGSAAFIARERAS